ncbi:MAG: 4-hydroxy-tetrahydrodipicolinate synthase [Fastidiosipilaceae bacterium]
MAKKVIYEGAGVAIVTPFNESGVDYNKFKELIERQIKAGTDAIIVCGTTGEASTMPDDEHIEVIRFAVEVVNKRIPVIAGTGSNDTAHGIELSKMAEETGTDALLLVTPYYNKTSQKGLVEHYKKTAAAVNLPIVLYNVPSRTSLNIAPTTYEALAEVDNIVAIKECNIHQVAETMQRCPGAFTYYSGEDGLVVPLMALGGKGVISVLSNVWPERVVELTHSFLDGDVRGAAEIQVSLQALVNALFSDVNPIAVKESMNMMGLEVGECRLPLTTMTEEGAAKLETCLKTYGLLD